MPQLLLCSIVMQSIQIFNGGPVMFVVTCFFYLLFIMYKILLSRTELTKCTPSFLMDSCGHTILPGVSILFYMPELIRLVFEKFIFELEAFSCDFKIDCILVCQLISFNKKMVVSSGKFNIFISWSPIWTPLMIVLTLMKIASAL